MREYERIDATVLALGVHNSRRIYYKLTFAEVSAYLDRCSACATLAEHEIGRSRRVRGHGNKRSARRLDRTPTAS